MRVHTVDGPEGEPGNPYPETPDEVTETHGTDVPEESETEGETETESQPEDPQGDPLGTAAKWATIAHFVTELLKDPPPFF